MPGADLTGNTERIATRISTQELQRRWSAVRAAMADRGEFLPGTNIDSLATALLTTLQGGLLLTKTLRDPEPLETALNTMIDHIESFTAARTQRS